MNLVDANVLLYSVNDDSPHHPGCRDWLHDALASGRPVGLPWTSLLAFIRVSTHARILDRPLSPDNALSIVKAWLAHPCVSTPDPGPHHHRIMSDLLRRSGTAGNLTNDAHLAALAIDRGGKVVTLDRDFARFDVPIIVPGT